MTTHNYLELAGWIMTKWQRRLADAEGEYLTVAKQMRKQGYPLDVALLILLNVKERV
ncbi:hypothetical protein [Polaromonas sp.]|uniref:hypothetical protein n=1 Tax=Polaromonas sp. TaxID=1869339 RepID=UPI002487DB62|nr:hypothetical protein [Polaromonas sp.]MDI1339355.1 hypothetical protein [Polaromonas sp.]